MHSNVACAVEDSEQVATSKQSFSGILERLFAHEPDVPLHQIEGQLHRELMELGRLLLQERIERCGDGDVGRGIELDPSRDQLTHKRPSTRSYESIFGTVKIRRIGYGKPGWVSVFPLDQQMCLPDEKYSFALQEKVCQQAVLEPFDEALTTVKRFLPAHIPKRQALEAVMTAGSVVDEFYAHRDKRTTRGPGDIVVMTMDGKGIVMRPEYLDEDYNRSVHKDLRLPSKHDGEQKLGKKRMAVVASVYNLQRVGREPKDILSELGGQHHKARAAATPQAKRVWATLRKNIHDVAKDLVQEAERRYCRGREIVFISDGGAGLQQAVLSELKKSPKLNDKQVILILDIIHVIQYLWKAAGAFFSTESPRAQQWVRTRLARILDGKVVHVAAGIRRSATLRQLCGEKRQAVDTAANYFLRFKHAMRYDEFLHAGYPIATGVIEGACKHVVKDRFELSGARWGLAGADALLKLRSVWLSGDWDAFWRYRVDNDPRRKWPSWQWEWKPIEDSRRPTLTLLNGGLSSG
jgi:hypothetical protein